MTYDEISPVMRKWIGGFEAFRKLGFSADDIYLSVARSARNLGLMSCFVCLRAQGREFNLEIGPVDNGESFEREYRRVAMAIDKVPEADLLRMWEESEVFSRKLDFVMALLNKGFVPPREFN